MIIILLCLLIGICIGLNIPIVFSPDYYQYFAVAILAAMDTLFGGITAYISGQFDTKIFVSGFFGNSVLAALLTFIGDKLGVQLYFAAIFTFGTRLFQNFAVIRRFLLNKYCKKGNI